jgi:hypothetical protein
VRDVLRDCHRIAVAGLTLTARSVRSSPGGEADGTVRAGPESTEHQIDVDAGYAQALRDASARQARAARRGVPGQPGADAGHRRAW